MDLPSSKIVYRTIKIEGLDMFYREAGPKDAPVALLLHGFPSSSFMFRNLIPLLADKYHVVAPDFPGYGFSSAPCVANEGTRGFSTDRGVQQQSVDRDAGSQYRGMARKTLAARAANSFQQSLPVRDFGPTDFRPAYYSPLRTFSLASA